MFPDLAIFGKDSENAPGWPERENSQAWRDQDFFQNFHHGNGVVKKDRACAPEAA